MWTALITALSTLGSSWLNKKVESDKAEIDYQKSLAKGEIDWDVIALKNAQYSIKDEILTIVWVTPLIVAWFDPERAMKWIEFVSELPVWYQVGLFGILAASFGLRWYFKQTGFKINK